MSDRGHLIRRYLAPALFVGALFAVVVLRDRPPAENEAEMVTFSGATMGTEFTVKVVALAPTSTDAVQQEIQKVLAAVDTSMSSLAMANDALSHQASLMTR